MRFVSAFTVSASLLLASCALSPDQEFRKLLVGQWEHKVGVMRERRTSQLTFAADGTFLQSGYSESHGMRIAYVPAKGTWSLVGSTLEMHYQAEQSSSQPALTHTDVRRVVRLTESEFVSADVKFGIELAYIRSKSQ
jgi:hypothetical protein